MASMAFGSPSRYIQGPGELARLTAHTGKYGRKVFAVIDSWFFDDLSARLKELFDSCGRAFEPACFSGEITKEVIEGYCEKAQACEADVIVGIGGGKTLDSAKAVAAKQGCSLVVVPTSASTDAPTSAMSIIYNERHEHVDVYYYSKNPDLVLVDSRIIADAPVRFLVSGMADALATTYEARATLLTKSPNYIDQETGPYGATLTACAVAELCAETIFKYGEDAKEANEAHIVNEALEAVIEANTLMSGLGFENVGCAASHVIHNGISATAEGDKSLHGEKVAYGILCQLTAEGNLEERAKVRAFFHAVGLPLYLKDLGVPATEENLRIISGDTKNTEWTREPFPMDDEAVYKVLKEVESLPPL